MHAAFGRELVAIPGVRVLIDTPADGGVAMCVAASGSHRPFADFEDRIFSAIEAEHGKPATDLFLHAAAAMGVDPSRTTVIEDSVYGVQAAVVAGMTR